MKSSPHRRVIAPLAALAVFALALTGCSSDPSANAAVGKADGVVTISGPIVGNDAVVLEKSWEGWEAANKITIKYQGSSNFEENIASSAQDHKTTDLAIFAQPGLIGDLATRGYMQRIPAGVEKNITANFPKDWASYTTFDGVQYAAPLQASLNGWIWYSPSQFKEWGVSVPKSWSDLITLTLEIQQKTGSAPWCEGFNADAQSGAAGTDWVEDLILRRDGAAFYDKWVKHKVPFTDPRIKQAFSDVSEILLDSRYTNAGIGDTKSIDTATTLDVAKSLAAGTCALTHQDTTFANVLTDPAVGSPTVKPNGDLWAFLLPPISGNTIPVTGGGDFVAAFSNDKDTVRVQEYLSSTSWAKIRVGLGGAISPSKAVTSDLAADPLLSESIDVLHNPKTIFRFDGSSLMPSLVGSGTFWTGMVNWIRGEPTAKVLKGIDDSWPLPQ